MGGDSDNDDEFSNEYERWRRLKPRWTNTQLKTDCPIKYWVALRHKYPTLSRFAIDILSIPAASSECERMFSEVGDLLAPRQHCIGPQLLAALQCIWTWMSSGMRLPTASTTMLNNDKLERLYSLTTWEFPEDRGKLRP
jgi:hypothetical protein